MERKKPPTEHPQRTGPSDAPAASPVRSTAPGGSLATKNAPAPAPAADAAATVPEPSLKAQIGALKVALETVRAERDALAAELRERNQTTAAFLALIERRRRQAREREQEHDPESHGTLH